MDTNIGVSFAELVVIARRPQTPCEVHIPLCDVQIEPGRILLGHIVIGPLPPRAVLALSLSRQVGGREGLADERGGIDAFALADEHYSVVLGKGSLVLQVSSLSKDHLRKL